MKEIKADARHYIDQDFWEDWARFFGGREIMQAWLVKFKRVVTKRNLDYTTRSQFYYFMELNRDITGYTIGPHTDSENKWVTTLYYLPSDMSRITQGGTSVVKSKTGKDQKVGSKREGWNDRQWTVAKKAAYVPNSVFAFAPCFTSWHAVPRVNQAFARDTIQGFISSRKQVPKKNC